MAVIDIVFDGWFVASKTVNFGAINYVVDDSELARLALDAAIEDGELAPEDRKTAIWRLRDPGDPWEVREAKSGYEAVQVPLKGGAPARAGPFATEREAHDWLLELLGFAAS